MDTENIRKRHFFFLPRVLYYLVFFRATTGHRWAFLLPAFRVTDCTDVTDGVSCHCFFALPLTFLMYTLGEGGTAFTEGNNGFSTLSGASVFFASLLPDDVILAGFGASVIATSVLVSPGGETVNAPPPPPIPPAFCFLAAPVEVCSSGFLSGVSFLAPRNGVFDLAGVLGGVFAPTITLKDEPEKKQK